MTAHQPQPFIVVGVDGSDCSIEALRWAASQAAATGAQLHAVIAWRLPEIYAYTPRDYAADARAALDTALKTAFGDGLRDDVITHVVEGPAAPALIGASRGAELLVVGCRGHGHFDGMLLGSVSQHCVQHANCPVLVMRHCR